MHDSTMPSRTCWMTSLSLPSWPFGNSFTSTAPLVLASTRDLNTVVIVPEWDSSGSAGLRCPIRIVTSAAIAALDARNAAAAAAVNRLMLFVYLIVRLLVLWFDG